MNSKLPKIYPITDVAAAGVSHIAQVEALIAGGARLIQLREKNASALELFETVSGAVAIAKRYGAKLVINDRVDIALAAKADGVHLGQHDMPVAEARKMLGDAAIIGLSTHSVEQASAALSLPLDYIAIGPIFETMTKKDPDAVVGLDGLRLVRQTVGNYPLVAIGGIDEHNLRNVFEAGADSAAMIGAILSYPGDIAERMRHFDSRSRNIC